MNYLQIFKDAIRLFRTSRLIWIFGIFSILPNLYHPIYQFAKGSFTLLCLAAAIGFALIPFSLIGEGGLIHITYQKLFDNNPNFSEAWLSGRTRIYRLIGVLLLSGLGYLILYLIFYFIGLQIPGSSFLWIGAIILSTFPESLYTFGICAVIINHAKVVAAAWTGLLITLNNLFRVLIIFGIVFLIRLFVTALLVSILAFGPGKSILPTPLAFDYQTYFNLLITPVIATSQLVLSLFLEPLQTVMFTLGYIRFTREITYPALPKLQNPA